MAAYSRLSIAPKLKWSAVAQQNRATAMALVLVPSRLGYIGWDTSVGFFDSRAGARRAAFAILGRPAPNRACASRGLSIQHSIKRRFRHQQPLPNPNCRKIASLCGLIGLVTPDP